MPEHRDNLRILPAAERREIRLALQRLASGYYNRPDVLREVARRILMLEESPDGSM